MSCCRQHSIVYLTDVREKLQCLQLIALCRCADALYIGFQMPVFHNLLCQQISLLPQWIGVLMVGTWKLGDVSVGEHRPWALHMEVWLPVLFPTNLATGLAHGSS